MRRKVLVVGSSGDIGTACIERQVREGRQVIGMDRDPKSANSDLQDFFAVDLRDSHALNQSCCELRQRHAPFWGLVLCAAVYPIVSLNDYSLELWDEVHNVNVRSMFQVISAL